MSRPDSPGFWNDAEVIQGYSRAQAISDGVLVDVSEAAREAGFKFPVALTDSVWALLTPSEKAEDLGQSVRGRLWDVLMVLRANAGDTDIALFDVLIAEDGPPKPVRLKAHIGPGDDAEPVITIMLPEED